MHTLRMPTSRAEHGYGTQASRMTPWMLCQTQSQSMYCFFNLEAKRPRKKWRQRDTELPPTGSLAKCLQGRKCDPGFLSGRQELNHPRHRCRSQERNQALQRGTRHPNWELLRELPHCLHQQQTHKTDTQQSEETTPKFLSLRSAHCLSSKLRQHLAVN